MIRRLAYYLNEMFPLSSFVGSVLAGLAIELVYLRLFDVHLSNYGLLILPAIVITLISLLLRIMDEFKDYDDDLKNFPMRPLPSGKVKKTDLLILGIFCVLGVILLSLTSKVMLLAGLFNLFFSYLMLKWFFMEEKMRKSLPFALVTHHPIVFFNFIYVILGTMEVSSVVDFSQAFLVLPVCFIFTNWEIARKIRSPQDETSYVTYSKILGPRKAVGIAIFLQIIFVTAGYLILDRLGISLLGRMIYLSVQILLMIPYLKFFKTLMVQVPFKKIAEFQILTIVFSLFLAAVL